MHTISTLCCIKEHITAVSLIKYNVYKLYNITFFLVPIVHPLENGSTLKERLPLCIIPYGRIQPKFKMPTGSKYSWILFGEWKTGKTNQNQSNFLLFDAINPELSYMIYFIIGSIYVINVGFPMDLWPNGLKSCPIFKPRIVWYLHLKYSFTPLQWSALFW